MALKVRTSAKAKTNKPDPKMKMWSTHNNLPVVTRQAVIAALAPALASSVDLHWQAKSAHWNVKGPNFIGLHELFDTVAEEVDGWADLLAERIVQLGGLAEGTVQVAATQSVLAPYPLSITANTDHVEALAKALADYGRLLRGLIDTTGDLGDLDAADICTEVSRAADKMLWFVEAHR